MAIKILDVGQCGFDGSRMAALWRAKLDADGSSGLDVIADLLNAKTSPRRPFQVGGTRGRLRMQS